MPAPLNVSTLPASEPGPLNTLKVTAFPFAPPVALSVTLSPVPMVAGAVKAMLCAALATVNVRSTGVAAA